ncbi:MAG: TolC family protein [Proteobacteria bacterium]|nr:TolC family protein [Pseudomonadota bacterium]
MYEHNSKKMLCLCLLLTGLPNMVFAKESDADLQWLQKQILKHPSVIAAKKAMSSSLYLADGLEKAIYNPELSTDFEREGSTKNYSLGISQTIDRSDKRGSRTQQATYVRIAAKKNYEMLVQEKTAEALYGLIRWQASQKQSILVAKQELQLENLLAIVKKRQQSGDLGQLDAELAFLSLSQLFGQSARVQAQLKRAEFQVRELLPDWDAKNTPFAESLLSGNVKTSTQQILDSHPFVLAAKAQWDVSQSSAELARKNKKADPTFGLSAGKVDNDNLLAVSFSMPLNFRNNFSSEYQAALQMALSAESAYMAIRRKQQFTIEASQAALVEYQNRYNKWQFLMQGRDTMSENLLEKQWNVGDISTTEYLLTLQQRTEGLIAGIDLEKEYQMALVQLLIDTAQFGTITNN